MSDLPTKIAVKRDGPRGWHWIARENYDPKMHVRHALDPLDGDSDGKKGGSLPKEHVHVPADYEVDGRDPPSKPKRSPRKKGA